MDTETTGSTLLLPTKGAAKLVGCNNSQQFLREVSRGIWPEAFIKSSRPHRWSTQELQNRINPDHISNSDHAGLRALEEALKLS
ncbi:MAG: hypothetical protein HN578_21755 [Rhodospirillales bacterium]|jgi:hypothetical protein|nr:hypothetical protein [Rhodospirillales bacterium]